MSYLETDGPRLHIQQLNPDGHETIILLHGLLVGSLAMWYFTVAPLLAENYRVIMYDLRSHGKSEKVDSGFDIKTMVKDLEAVIAHFKLKNVSIAGHSYGALIALNYALNNPGRVKKLAIIEAPLPPSDMREMEMFLNSSPDEMVAALPEWMQSLVISGKRQANKLLQSLSFLAFKSTLFSDLEKETDLENPVLNKLGVPTLLLYGAHSSCRPCGLRLVNEIPDSTLVTLQGGHYLPVECAADVNKQLMEFFCGNNQSKWHRFSLSVSRKRRQNDCL